MRSTASLLLLLLLMFHLSLSFESSAGVRKTEQYWKQKIEQNPDNKAYVFNLANLYQREKKYQKSIILYSEVIEDDGGLKYAATLYLGLAYSKIDQSQKALNALNSILRQDDAPSNVISKAKVYIDRIKDQTRNKKDKFSSKRFRGGLSVKSGHNSNPFLESESGLDILGNPQTVVSDTQIQYNTYLGYKYFSGVSSDAKINLFYTKIDFVTDSSANSSYLGVDLPITYYTKKIRYRLIPSYTTENDSEEAILATGSGRFDLTYKWDSKQLTIGLTSSTYSEFDSLYEYLSGQGLKLNLSYSNMSLHSLYLLTASIFQKDLKDSDLLTRSHDGFKLYIAYNRFFGKFSTAISGIYQFKTYKIDAIELFSREDNLFGIATKIKYSLSKSFKLLAEIDYTLNISNFDGKISDEDFNYNKFGILFGGQLAF